MGRLNCRRMEIVQWHNSVKRCILNRDDYETGRVVNYGRTKTTRVMYAGDLWKIERKSQECQVGVT